MNQLLIATKNKGKIKEIKEILSGLPFEFKSLDDVDFKEEIKETGKNFEENACIKAKSVGKKTGLLTLAEDSGLEIDALGGKPGVYSARYCQGSDLDRINKILGEFRGIPEEKKTARFVSVVAIYDPVSKKTYIFEGVSKGGITEKPIGKDGFGYDPIFYNFDLKKTNAQASLEEKNKVSHRGRAIRKAKLILEKLLNNNQ